MCTDDREGEGELGGKWMRGGGGKGEEKVMCYLPIYRIRVTCVHVDKPCHCSVDRWKHDQIHRLVRQSKIR